MLKSSKLKITFVVITMLLLLTTTTAIELKANPAYLKIPVGSYNISTINAYDRNRYIYWISWTKYTEI